MPIIADDRDDFLKAIGFAIEAHSKVELAQVRLFQNLISVDSIQARIIFFTIQNVTSRNGLIRSLLVLLIPFTQGYAISGVRW